MEKCTQTWLCGNCGKTCTRIAVRGQRPKWCGPICAEIGKRPARICEQCGDTYQGRGARFCSIRCAANARVGSNRELVKSRAIVVPRVRVPPSQLADRGGAWWLGFVSGPCSWCGTPFTATTSTWTERFCSNVCARRHRKSRYKFYPTPAVRLAIYERDRWTCQLCREPVDRNVDPLDDWAPSLDHIEPQSSALIPDHSLRNLRLAHRWCNAIRGDGTYHIEFFEEAS